MDIDVKLECKVCRFVFDFTADRKDLGPVLCPQCLHAIANHYPTGFEPVDTECKILKLKWVDHA